MPLTVLCIATYHKGDEFLRECRRHGCRVLLLTEEKLRDADWPREAIDSFSFIHRDMPDRDIRSGAAYLARTERLDRIVALDDFDVELAAMLREYLRVPGMGQTTARGFRDKLAMRGLARAAGIRCPEFVAVINRQDLTDWIGRVPPPWLLKPRSQAAAIGIHRVESSDDLWAIVERLGDTRSDYLLEQFVGGDVYHVDSVVFNRRVVFALASHYKTPPMAVAHEGGIFVTSTLADADPRATVLRALNEQILTTLGLVRGASHTEMIHAADGTWHFLETSARVGGAYIVDVVAAATGVNLWREWAATELAGDEGTYAPPAAAYRDAGIILSLARQAQPDTAAYQDPAIVARVVKAHHAGLILASDQPGHVEALLGDYAERFKADFHASAPAPERPTD